MASSTSTNEKHSIPLDVVEIIIDILATIDDQRLSSVKKCSLACRSFLHFCRKHIFASVSIREDNGPRSMLKITRMGNSHFQYFQKLLITAPELVNYVRKLTLRISGYERPSDPEVPQDYSNMLKKFTQIQELTIRSCWMELIVWTDLPDCLQGAVIHLLSLLTIKNVALSTICYFPILGLTRCINLRRLHITQSSFSMGGMFDPISPIPRSVILEEYFVELGGFQATKSMITSKWPNGRPVFDFSHLKEYSAPYNASDTKHSELTQQFFKSTNQLASIEFYLQGDSITNLSEFSNTIRLSLKSLKRITLRGGYGHTVANAWDGLSGLRDQLKVIREWPNVLEELRISILCLQPHQVEMMATGRGWSFEFDECLNHTGWSSLKKISIEIKTTQTLSEVYHQEEGAGFAQFPFLSSNKAITFCFTVLPMDLFSAQ